MQTSWSTSAAAWSRTSAAGSRTSMSRPYRTAGGTSRSAAGKNGPSHRKRARLFGELGFGKGRHWVRAIPCIPARVDERLESRVPAGAAVQVGVVAFLVVPGRERW